PAWSEKRRIALPSWRRRRLDRARSKQMNYHDFAQVCPNPGPRLARGSRARCLGHSRRPADPPPRLARDRVWSAHPLGSYWPRDSRSRRKDAASRMDGSRGQLGIDGVHDVCNPGGGRGWRRRPFLLAFLLALAALSAAPAWAAAAKAVPTL